MMVSDACDLVAGQTHQGPRPLLLDKYYNEQRRTTSIYGCLNWRTELVSRALDSKSDSYSVRIFIMLAVTVLCWEYLKAIAMLKLLGITHQRIRKKKQWHVIIHRFTFCLLCCIICIIFYPCHAFVSHSILSTSVHTSHVTHAFVTQMVCKERWNVMRK
jgi:hypothetical protein